MTKAQEIAALKKKLAQAKKTLRIYADPGFYHGVGFLFDPPGGGFMDDFTLDHGDPDYSRPMAGRLARETLAKLEKK